MAAPQGMGRRIPARTRFPLHADRDGKSDSVVLEPQTIKGSSWLIFR